MKKLLFILLLPTVLFAQLELPFPVKVVNPKPLDFWYYESDGTPYDNTTEAITQVISAVRFIGMTVNVNGVEYWWKDGTADIDLVAKGGSTAWGDITGKPTFFPADTTLFWKTNGNTELQSAATLKVKPYSVILGDTNFVTPGLGNYIIIKDDSQRYVRIGSGNTSLTIDSTGFVMQFLTGSGFSNLAYSPMQGLYTSAKMTFLAGSTRAGLNVGSTISSPTGSNGDLWYQSNNHYYEGVINSVRHRFATISSATSLQTNRAAVWSSAGNTSILSQTPYTLPTGSGTNGQVLTTNGSGTASWQTPSSGFSDPMTTRGDIIIRDPSNTTVRLGIGTNGQVLTSDGTDVAWAAPSGGISGSGTTNELTYWTGSSAIGSLSTATYPSLTELSYVKGLTSSAQTQITAREVLTNKATDLATLNNNLYPTTQSLFQQRSVTGTDAIVSTDNGKTIVFNSATPFNFTIDALTTGMQMGLINKGTGTVTLVAGSGVTLGGVTSLATNESAAVIYYTSTSVDAIGGGGTALTNPMTTRGDIIIRNASNVTARLPIGTATYVLTSDGTDVAWAAPSGGGGTWGSITGTLSSQTDLQTALDAKLLKAGDAYTTTTGNGLDITSSTVTSGNLVSITNTGTAAASNTKTVLNVASSGANGTSTQTTYAGRFSNTNTGTSSTNYGLFATASGGSTNYAIGTSGNVNIGGGLYMNGNPMFTLSGSTQVNLSPSTLFYNGAFTLRSGSTSPTLIGNGTSASATGALRVLHQNTLTLTSGSSSMIQVDGGFAPTSGTAILNGYLWNNVINQTGGANGNIYGLNLAPTYTAAGGDVHGIYYNPTVTSVTGVNYSFRATSGNVLLPASSYINYNTTSGSSGYGFRDNSGVVEIKDSGGDWASPGAGIRKKKVSISSAEILNMYTAAKELLAAPGSGKANEVISITIRYNYLTAAYATNTTLNVLYSTVVAASHTGILNQTSSKIKIASSGLNSLLDASAVENQAVALSVDSGNPTGGSGTLDVYITYRIIDL